MATQIHIYLKIWHNQYFCSNKLEFVKKNLYKSFENKFDLFHANLYKFEINQTEHVFLSKIDVQALTCFLSSKISFLNHSKYESHRHIFNSLQSTFLLTHFHLGKAKCCKNKRMVYGDHLNPEENCHMIKLDLLKVVQACLLEFAE